MCTAISYKNGDAYFGRNLDLERGYGENVVITPRNYELKLRYESNIPYHYAMIGMAAVVNDFPLYYEATNEKGLSMAGLNFPDNATYYKYDNSKCNIAPFEFIPWLLSKCSTIKQTQQLINNINLVNVNFSDKLPLSPLHWLISDKESSIVVESLKDKIKIYQNPFEVLTNNPTFDYHSINVSNYMGIHNGPANNQFHKSVALNNYSLGMGALGLPGDFSSTSRFVKAFFVKENFACPRDEKSNVNQFFHILDSVSMPKGCVWTKNGFEYTRYSSCCNTNKGVYYYKTYNNFTINSINMRDVDLEKSNLIAYQVQGLD